MSNNQANITERIFLSAPHMGGEEYELVSKAFASNYIAPAGPMIDAFEKAFADYTGIPHTVALTSGTAAIHLALRLAGVGQGDDVWTPSLTFIGGVSPILYQGANPVFLDVDPQTWTLDTALLKDELEKAAAHGKLPKAVLPTDLYGQSCDLDAIVEICDPYDIPVITDSAESVGTRYKDRHAGNGAFAAAYSFNGNKIITCAGGGMLASHDKAMIDQARALSQQARKPAAHYEHETYGYNYRMSNILAAIGLGQLGILDHHVSKKQDIFQRYHQALSPLEGLSFMPEANYGVGTRWLTVMMIDPQTGLKPMDFVTALEAENIEARPAWKPMHMQPVFENARMIGGTISEDVFNRGLCLPCGPGMTDQQLDRAIFSITAIYETKNTVSSNHPPKTMSNMA